MRWFGRPDTLIYQWILNQSNQQLRGIKAGLPLQREPAISVSSQYIRKRISFEVERNLDVFFPRGLKTSLIL